MEIITIINIITILLFPLIFTGLINKTKAFWGGRKGAPLLQPFHDVIRLLKKGEVISSVTTPVFMIFPVVSLSSVLFAALLLPAIGHRSVISFEGSFIMFAYILALGKFISITGALDTGSSFEGMGAAREAFFTSIPEPAFFLILGSLSVFNGSTSFEQLFHIERASSELSILIISLTVLILFVILLVEGCRIPVDDPNTHLELTMVHEVMVLDNSGPSLALISYSSSMKMMLLSGLMINFIIPDTLAPLTHGILFISGLAATAITVGTVESVVARFRIVRVPDFIFTIVGLGLIVMFITLLYNFGGGK